MTKVMGFLKDVRIELSKVSWPTRQQLVLYTIVVIGVSLFVAVFLGSLDLVFQWILNNFIIS
jgi:preprotein translocase subunit SecE